MRRRTWIIGAAVVAVVGIGGWTGAWFLGQGEVEARLAAITEEADAKGWSVTHNEPEIGGFPMGYTIRLPDVAVVRRDTGLMIRLPEVTANWDGAAVNQVILDLPETFELIQPNSELDRLNDPGLPASFNLKGKARDWQMWMATDAPNGVMTAAMLEIALDQEDYPTSSTLTLVSAEADLPLNPTDPLSLRAASATGTMRNAEEAGPQITLNVETEGLDALVAMGELPLAEVLYGGAEGAARLQYSITSSVGRLVVVEDPLNMDGVLEFTTGESTGAFEGRAGIVDVATETMDGTWTLTAPDGQGGTVTSARTELAYTVPTSPSQIPVPGRLKVALEQIEGAPDLWQTFDPSGKLDQGAGNLVLDISLTARLMARMDRLPAGLAPPYEVSNVSLNQALVSALGAEFQAEGDIEMIQPVQIPEGQIEMRGAGLSALIVSLTEAGILPQELRETAEAILQVYARPAAGDDSWESVLRIGQEGISLNGLPVQ